jgi:Chaperone of endosialidase
MTMAEFDNLRVTQQAYIGSGGSSDAQLHIWRNDNQDTKILVERAGGAIVKLAVTPENNASIGTIGNFPLQLQAAGTLGIYISNDSGKVGIGTSSPKQNLDVQGIVNATQYYKNGAPWKITDNDIDVKTISGDRIRDKSISQDKLDFSISPGNNFWEKSSNSSNIYYSGGNVGIGTSSPKQNLDVQGIVNATQYYKNGAPWQLTSDDIANNAITTNKIQKGAITREKLDPSIPIGGGAGGSQWVDGSNSSISYSKGNVGIGIKTGKPEAILHISAPSEFQNFGGNIKVFPTSGRGVDFSYDGGTDGIFGFTNYGKEEGDTRFQWQAENGSFRGLLTITNKGEVRGRLVNTSSRALKENITDFSTQEAIDVLAQLNPVRFKYREDKEKEATVGFIAEDVPDLLATHDRKGVCALEIVAVLTKVIQQQQEELSHLREKVNTLEHQYISQNYG